MNAVSCRIITMSFVTVSIILMASYSSLIVAVLISMNSKMPFESLGEVVEGFTYDLRTVPTYHYMESFKVRFVILADL